MIYTSVGKKIEQRANLPKRSNVHLKDGRILRYQGNCLGVERSCVYDCGDGMRVIASMDETDTFGLLLHVSVSYQQRDPSWEDIKRVRAAFFPEDIDCMMVLPKSEDYVNLHQHAFHIWQTPTEWGIC